MLNTEPIIKSDDNPDISKYTDDFINLYQNISYLSDTKLERMQLDNIITQDNKTNFIEYRNNLTFSYQNIINKSYGEILLNESLNNIPSFLIKFQLNDISKNIDMNLFSRSVAKICTFKPYNIVKHFNSIIDYSISDTNIQQILYDQHICLYPYFIITRLPYKYDDNTTLVSAIKSKPVVSNGSIETTVYPYDTSNGNGKLLVSFTKPTVAQNTTYEPIKINIQLEKEEINYS
jgi:hypothetical protein